MNLQNNDSPTKLKSFLIHPEYTPACLQTALPATLRNRLAGKGQIEINLDSGHF